MLCNIALRLNSGVRTFSAFSYTRTPGLQLPAAADYLRERLTRRVSIDQVIGPVSESSEVFSYRAGDLLGLRPGRGLTADLAPAAAISLNHTGVAKPTFTWPLFVEAASGSVNDVTFGWRRRVTGRHVATGALARWRFGGRRLIVTEDPGAARQLIGEKEIFREVESRATEAHFVRRDSRSESVEAGRLHLDIVRDLKRINAHLSAAAYPVLENRGELLSSRLRYDAN
jgi:hypothetical protein